MKKLKALNEIVRQYNGLIARTKKDPSNENKEALNDVIAKLKQEVEGLQP